MAKREALRELQSRLAQRLQAALTEAHPYELPEIIAIPLHKGLPAYLAWIGNETLEHPL